MQTLSQSCDRLQDQAGYIGSGQRSIIYLDSVSDQPAYIYPPDEIPTLQGKNNHRRRELTIHGDLWWWSHSCCPIVYRDIQTCFKQRVWHICAPRNVCQLSIINRDILSLGRALVFLHFHIYHFSRSRACSMVSMIWRKIMALYFSLAFFELVWLCRRAEKNDRYVLLVECAFMLYHEPLTCISVERPSCRVSVSINLHAIIIRAIMKSFYNDFSKTWSCL
jgi:hypothetical protein